MNRLLLGVARNAAPFALPRLVDQVSERWWSLPPRIRFIIVATAIALVAVMSGARLMLSPYGPPETVLVSRTALAAGTVVRVDDVEQVRWPRDLIPAAALTADGFPVDRELRLRTPVPQGGVLTAAHVGDHGIGGIVPHDRVAVPLATDILPPLPAGTRFDLVSRDQQGRGVVIARDAAAVAYDGDVTWVAVEPHDGAAVAAAASSGINAIIPVVQPTPASSINAPAIP